ncbi:hypothetical protein SLEP1_g30011 [Rubroshorea leprosula]|uniref:Uncharacterized protein n=1 Tax=Rubroshorea leprosula TaxID=152421 RepID=A0AAV5K7F0_9ROSI|nr:hypothetical protein SLEP1_g30011 [Rubroshorea leprosula]
MTSNSLLRLKILSILYLLFLSIKSVDSQWIVNRLPGFDGDLPFTLETGYIGVGENDEVQLFYYFIESERSPKDDPLLLWLTGGPGCSGLCGLVFEIGPLQFNYINSSGNKPTFELNPYSWTKVANIIFLDQPAGTGFSYATSPEAYNVSDTLAAAKIYTFLKKWFIVHTNFLTNPLYISGDSYSGIAVPLVVELISNGNEVGHYPPLNLQGYTLGNPYTYLVNDSNSKVPFAYRKALLPRPFYESIKRNCKGQYVYNPDPSNPKCVHDAMVFQAWTKDIYLAQILEPKCEHKLHPKPNITTFNRRSLIRFRDSHPSTSKPSKRWCRYDNYGTKEEWLRCNRSLSYTYDIESTVEYHRNLSKKAYLALIYSGDHDMYVPYVGTNEWIESLNLTIQDEWRPWFVQGQVAGYTKMYKQERYYLTFATVKGGGHTAPEYKPEQCLAMIDRWLSHYPL